MRDLTLVFVSWAVRWFSQIILVSSKHKICELYVLNFRDERREIKYLPGSWVFKFTLLRVCSGCTTELGAENWTVFRQFSTFLTLPCNHALPVLSQEKLRIEICRLNAETIVVHEQFSLLTIDLYSLHGRDYVSVKYDFIKSIFIQIYPCLINPTISALRSIKIK